MNVEQRYLEVVKRKETITSLELVEQINFFRKQEENKTELRHDTLLGIIRDEFEEEISLQKILESTYKNDRGREYPMFNLTISQSKQVLMRESKFVRKAVINYIDKLELELQKPLTVEEMIISQAKSVIELKNRFDSLEDKVNNQMTINSNRQRIIQNSVSKKVHSRIEKIALACCVDKELKSILYSNLYRELKNKFGVGSYKDILEKDFDDAINFINNWLENSRIREVYYGK
ncbi:MAG: ORF6C domain-containing protein [Cetobacterium somerae]|uniref:ORF6C domain-containing protein n=1 Tax=Cetobacterium somerae TaxID=188913 RepID=UPI003F40B857